MIPIFLKFKLQRHRTQSECEVLINPLEISSVEPIDRNDPQGGTKVLMRTMQDRESTFYHLDTSFDKMEEILQDTLRELRLQK